MLLQVDEDVWRIAVGDLVLQLCCNGKDTTIIECAKEKGRKFNP